MIKGFDFYYNTSLAFAWNTNQKEIDKYLEEKCAPNDDARSEIYEFLDKDIVSALTIPIDNINILVIFKDEPTPEIVAHEIFHAVHAILYPRGIMIEDQEAWAYPIGNATSMFYELYNEKDE